MAYLLKCDRCGKTEQVPDDSENCGHRGEMPGWVGLEVAQEPERRQPRLISPFGVTSRQKFITCGVCAGFVEAALRNLLPGCFKSFADVRELDEKAAQQREGMIGVLR